MNLTYLTTGKAPSNELISQFDDTRIIKVNPKNVASKVSSTEKEMRNSGSYPFDINDMVLWTPEIADLGEVVARNRLNAGMVDDNNSIVRIGNQNIHSKVKFGDTLINLTCASRLPDDKKAKNILFVCPHWEEETGLIGSYLHKNNKDNVYVLFATDIPKGKTNHETLVRNKKAHQVYREVVGLTENEYSFMGIPDREITDHKQEFQSILEKKIHEFNPDTVIMPPQGSNFDHNFALEYSLPVLEESGIDLLLSEVVQDTRLRPSIFPVLDWSEVEKFVDVYADGNFGGAQYKPMVRNIFTKLPEGLNRLVGENHKEGRTDVNVGVFGLQPVRLVNGYRVPHSTKIFESN